ncbi:hypothetical protein NX801_04915 [Streptomyces sp. LP05-1]|uniref:Lipoprotein n=1 Tax=Streptomyces pyxinae TaxID=2970734 RepID=A0ABT2CC78_9ACTN|nr:hypothetical protein [Streptomyces sp. LP05-1]MCS0635008.1 hypothetical protein [Streptomyces sp. LP05-1]
MKNSLARVAAALVCAAFAVSCTAPPEAPGSRAPGPKALSADPYEPLISRQNGLFYHPFLRAQPTSAQDQSFALRTLREGGARPKVALSAALTHEVREDALAVSGVWGRYWLIAFRDAGVRSALTGADADAVERLHRPGGWYTDPALGDEPSQRLSATWAALEVLAATGRLTGLPPERRRATAGWLGSQVKSTTGLEEAGAIARSLKLLGERVPDRLAALKAPTMRDFGSLTPEQRAQRLLDTYGYVLVAESAGVPVEVDRAAWQKALTDNTDNTDDTGNTGNTADTAGSEKADTASTGSADNAGGLEYDQLYYLARVLRSGGAGGGVLRPVVRRLEGNRLADGTVTDPSSYVGTGDASLFVQLLRELAGTPVRDARLARAVREAAASDDGPEDPAGRITRAALLRSAAGEPTPAEVRELCADGSVVPSTVTMANAVEWQRMALTCAQAGAETGVPKVTAWPVRTRPGIAAAAALVDGLTSRGTGKVPSWVDTASLRRAAIAPEAGTPLYERALAAHAYLRAGGKADAALLSALRGALTGLRGCPGLPDLYQVGAGDRGCDLKTTWAVRRLDGQLGGRLLHRTDGTPTSPEGGNQR